MNITKHVILQRRSPLVTGCRGSERDATPRPLPRPTLHNQSPKSQLAIIGPQEVVLNKGPGRPHYNVDVSVNCAAPTSLEHDPRTVDRSLFIRWKQTLSHYTH